MQETAYMKKGWNNNVQNCNIDEERSIMITDDIYDYEYTIMESGIIIGELGIDSDSFNLCSCGKWYWLEFTNKSDAMAFKLRWT